MTAALLADAAERKRALTDHAATLMVEAAAGTGKTALIAGRITMMLAAGTKPGSIAAVTFGEYAASELNARVAEYVTELLQDRIPKPLRFVFDAPLNETQKTNLERAREELDELACSTIHAFCQVLLAAHAIDANVDPGARVIDEQERQAVLDLVLDAWLEGRLSGVATPDDPIAHLAKNNPRGVVADLKQIAMMRVEHRTARAQRPDPNERPDRAFAESVARFRNWYEAAPDEPRTAVVLGELEHLVAFFGAPFESQSSFERLWALADPPRVAISEEDRDGVSRNLVAPSLEIAWRDVAKKRASVLHDQYKRLFADAAEHYARLINHIAASIIWRVSRELDGLLEAYQGYKRRTAMLDFEDLLCLARDLVRDNEEVRGVIAARFQHILVDEFQDTDTVQAELLFRIAASEAHADWAKSVLRAGALFIVGDPKQAIYGFRGGDIVTYSRVRATIARFWPENVLQLTANFRSRPAIIAHVNACFAQPFGQVSQPDYVPLVATLDDAEHGLPAAAKIEIEPDGNSVNALRDKEAATIADLCRRLIGAYPLRDRKLRAGDIALLTPQGTELGRYEQALQAQGIPFVSQAGKSLLKRQEAQDLLALTRTLANRRDFAAFGALMRGPLVGLSEAELLEIAAALPQEPGRPRFSMFTDAELISHQVARETLAMLQDLSEKARRSTPLLILSEALECLRVRAILAERREARGERAWANVEALLERTRPYGVSGLRKFARDFHRDWKAGTGAMEGRLDAEGDALQITTMHSAKGLEWPVVIPINAATQLRRVVKYVYRATDDTLHWIIGGVRAPELAASLQAAEREQISENIRLWYVACTRAQELLIVPELEGAKRISWAALVDLKHGTLPAWDVETFEAQALEPAVERENDQSVFIFAEQQARIAGNSLPVRWRVPSDGDFDRVPVLEALAAELTDVPSPLPIVGAGSLRGLVMHKLIEEVLTGETKAYAETLTARAGELTHQLAAQLEAKAALPVAQEMADAVLASLALPEIAAVRPRLLPEVSLYAELGPQELLAGRADAIAYDENGNAEIVFDWKSDVDPNEAVMAEHASQLSAYLVVTGAPRGALVYMSKGLIRWTSSPA
jgi:ATP-dependent exoDNAse (exonuclease V) beta subunit